MPRRSSFPWVLTLVLLAFNVIMLFGFFSLRAERRDCPEGWAGESCWEAQIGPAVAAEVWPELWVVGDVILGAVWIARCAWLVGTGRSVQVPGAPDSASEASRRLPATPFRFFATMSDVVLAPDTRQPIGNLVKDGEYTAVEVFGGEVLVEDKFGRRGWAPASVVPARVRRSQKGADAPATGDGEGGP